MSKSMHERSSSVKPYFLSAQAQVYFPHRTRRPVERRCFQRVSVMKSMTIAAGIRCSDGIVICADTQHTQGNMKFDQTKVWGVGDYLLMTGSGASNLMKMAFDKLAQEFMDNRPQDSFAARDVIENLVQSIHRQHIFPLYRVQHPSAQDMTLELIVCIRCKNGELALIDSNLTTAKIVDGYEAVGAGRDVFLYWANRFLWSRLNLELTGYLAKFFLRECKYVSSYVGGETIVATMFNSRADSKVYKVEAYEGYTLAWFPNSIVRMLLAAIDRNVTETEFEFQFKISTDEIKELRAEANANQISFSGAKVGFTEIGLIGGQTSYPASDSIEPEPPPEQSGSAVRRKGAQRGRRHP